MLPLGVSGTTFLVLVPVARLNQPRKDLCLIKVELGLIDSIFMKKKGKI